MKKRKSFVSNSSSCSFFVWLKTDKDAEEFNKIRDELLQKFSSYCGDVVESPSCYYNSIRDLKQNVIKNDIVRIYTGEDNEGDFRITELDDIYNFLMEKYRKFRIYSDPDAHYTYGYGNGNINNIKDYD